MKTIYFISGLGADSRAFNNITLPPDVQSVHLDWIPPHHNDTIATYAERICARINTSQPFYLAGLSFGGMIAVEMLNYVQPVKTILLSSAASKHELRKMYVWAGQVGLHRLFTRNLARSGSFLLSYLFQLKTSSERKLIMQMMNDTDPQFFKWAVQAIVSWQRTEAPAQIIRIHGTADRTLPPVNITYEYLIKGGGHFMVYSKAQELSQILEKILNEP